MSAHAAAGLGRNPVFAGGLLLAASVIAMVWANSPWGDAYAHFWHVEAGAHIGSLRLVKPLEVWVNDALMAVFFFLVGLEIRRELTVGRLSTWRAALLPAAAAVGGMVVPALVFLAFTRGQPGASGWGVPMATDIAFAVAVLALIGPRVPAGLRVFLVALAVIDDLGAIAVIALFYSTAINLLLLAAGCGALAVAYLCNRLRVEAWWAYAAIGIFGVWLAFLESGVHATVAGVLMAFTIPARGGEQSLSARLQHGLEPWVNCAIMPLFALANAGVRIDGGAGVIFQPVSLGIIAGLVVGKPVGITAAAWLAVRLAGARLPDGVAWRHVAACGLIAGIGFTMSLFIANLAFVDTPHHSVAKAAILVASSLAGVGGALWLRACVAPRGAAGL